jgi:hypothetical protein
MNIPTTVPAAARRIPALGLFGRRNVSTAIISLSLLAGATACGSDRDGDGLSAAACDAVAELDAAMAMAPQDPAEMAPFVDERLMPNVMTLMTELDGDAQHAAEIVHRAIEVVADSGDPSGMFAPETAAAQAEIGKAVHEGCDLTAAALIAEEYRFEGAPHTLPAGRVNFALTNEGVEEHEMVLFKRADGVTESLAELLQLPEDEGMSKMQFTGVTFGGPGSTSYVTVDLAAGTYFLVCFIPQGGGDDGAPHFMSGMQHTIVVA